MSFNINLNSLGGEYVKTATIGKWHKKEGDKVNEGDTLVTVETAKVTVDIPAPESGVIIKILYNKGDDVDINETIAVIGESSETIYNKIEKERQSALQSYSSKKEENNRIFITPIAKMIAKENNIDLEQIKGTGPNGRITKEDVHKYLKYKSNNLLEEAQKPSNEASEIIKVTGRRKAIGKKMSSSYSNIPHVTLMLDVEAGKLEEIKSILNSNADDVKISLTDLIMFFTVKALQKYPMLNSHYINDEIKVYSNVNLGIAVDLEDGLLVPVIKNCEKKTLFSLSIELKQLAEKAKRGNITPNEVTEGTFTISNLGMYGIKYFTPIINEPEVAILGVGQIENNEKPILPLSLSFDHRVIDGASASKFINNLKQIMENPYIVLFN